MQDPQKEREQQVERDTHRPEADLQSESEALSFDDEICHSMTRMWSLLWSARYADTQLQLFEHILVPMQELIIQESF